MKWSIVQYNLDNTHRETYYNKKLQFLKDIQCFTYKKRRILIFTLAFMYIIIRYMVYSLKIAMMGIDDENYKFLNIYDKI